MFDNLNFSYLYSKKDRNSNEIDKRALQCTYRHTCTLVITYFYKLYNTLKIVHQRWDSPHWTLLSYSIEIPIWAGILTFHLIWPILAIYFKMRWTAPWYTHLKASYLEECIRGNRETDIQLRQRDWKLGREKWGASAWITFTELGC